MLALIEDKCFVNELHTKQSKHRHHEPHFWAKDLPQMIKLDILSNGFLAIVFFVRFRSRLKEQKCHRPKSRTGRVQVRHIAAGPSPKKAQDDSIWRSES